ncbi:unnamed protein product [Diabrotica balteata]|uniref:Inositol-3-phosphate synthase n=1 Tax=Diabrotica balteata TaxID=107213 RepID=A0A9N9SZF2_DIABA|nr:unnamed protein product [Diabrotica balteata]
MSVVVNSDKVKYTDNFIETKYTYQYNKARKNGDVVEVTPISENLVLKTSKKVPKLGVMLVGWGGNNGSTFTAAVIANKLGLTWPTKKGVQQANWYGSLTQAATVALGDDVFVPFSKLLPMVHPDDIVIGGWDISSANLAESMERAQVLEPMLQQQLKPHMQTLKPKPSVYIPEFIAANQISKSNVVDDMVNSNDILYKPGEKPDHVVVIKYVPYVGDSKRALDEYTSEILMGGLNTLVIHNTCEDSLLATPIMLDLIILGELFTRIKIKRETSSDDEYTSFHPVLSVLSYLCKAPLVPKGTPVVNALNKQRACIENVIKACIGLPPENNMTLEHKLPFLMAENSKLDGEPLPKRIKMQNGQH